MVLLGDKRCLVPVEWALFGGSTTVTRMPFRHAEAIFFLQFLRFLFHDLT